MSYSKNIDISLKYYSFTDCLLDLVSNTLDDKRSSSIKLYIDFHKGNFNFICQGMALSRSEMKLINSRGQFEAKTNMSVVEDAFVLTLSRLAVHSVKIVIVASKKKRRHAYEVVFERGVRTRIGFIPAKNRVSTTIKMYGLMNIPRRTVDVGGFEYFVLRTHLKALALIHCSIPIDVTEKINGKVLRWPGKFTGLGSSFSALTQSDANEILPVHAKFHDVRMKAFLSLSMNPDKSLQYVFINNKFVRWNNLYTLFIRLLGKIFDIDTTSNKSHFKFVLCIECPNSYCRVHYGFFTPEIRLRFINPIISCFNVLFSNIEMMYNCKKWCQLYRWVLQNRDFSTRKDVFKGFYNKMVLLLDYSWENDFETLMEPLNLMKRRQGLRHYVDKRSEFLYSILLNVKNGFGSYQLTVCYTSLTISPPDLLQYLTFLLNAWIENPARRNRYFNFLKEMISSDRNMPTLEVIESLLRFYDISRHDITLELKCGPRNLEGISLFYDERYLRKTCSTGSGANVHEYNCDLPIYSRLMQQIKANLPQNFCTVGRNSYAPKGTSPMAAKIENIAVYNECGIGQCTTSRNIIQKSTALDRNLSSSNKTKLQNLDGDIQTIPKQLFGHMKVVGQLDTKFIICELKKEQNPNETGFIIFDQHGIDERIRLEDLSYSPSNDGSLPKFYMSNWILLKFGNKDLALLLRFINYFSKYGIDIVSFSSGTLTIQTIPEILHRLGGYWTRTASSYVSYMFNILKSIVEEQLQFIKCTGSATNVIPKVLHKQICKAACSSAIKFGQNLSFMDCCYLIEKLSRCDVPFLCAHGRPTAFFVGGIMLNAEKPTAPNLKALKEADIE